MRIQTVNWESRQALARFGLLSDQDGAGSALLDVEPWELGAEVDAAARQRGHVDRVVRAGGERRNLADIHTEERGELTPARRKW